MGLHIIRPNERVIMIPGIGITVRNALASGGGPLIWDTNTDANGTAMTAHTPDINTPGNAYLARASYQIQGNRVQDVAGGATECIINTGITDYTVTGKVILEATNSGEPRGLIVRGDDFPSVGYNKVRVGLVWSGNQFYIKEYNTVVASTAFTVTPGVQYTIKAICSGTSIIATVNGGNQISYNTAPITGRTYVGWANRYAGDLFDDLLVEV